MSEPVFTPPTSPQPSPGGYQPPTNDERTMALLCHLLPIFTWFIGPLIIWLIKKDESSFVNDQGKEALNFQITVGIGYVIGVVTACVYIGIFIIIAVKIVNLVFCIIAAIETNKGVPYRYPICIRLIT